MVSVLSSVLHGFRRPQCSPEIKWIKGVTFEEHAHHSPHLHLQEVPKINICLSDPCPEGDKRVLSRETYLRDPQWARAKFLSESVLKLSDDDATLTLTPGPYSPYGHVINFQNTSDAHTRFTPHEIPPESFGRQLKASGDQVKFFEDIFQAEKEQSIGDADRYTPEQPLIFCGGNLWHQIAGPLCLDAQMASATQLPLHLVSGILDASERMQADEIFEEQGLERPQKFLFDIPSIFHNDLNKVLWKRIERNFSRLGKSPWDLEINVNARNIEIAFPEGLSVSQILHDKSGFTPALFRAITKGMESLSNDIGKSCFQEFDPKLMKKILKQIGPYGISESEWNQLSAGLQTVSDSQLEKNLGKSDIDLLNIYDPLRTLLNNRRKFNEDPKNFDLETNPTLRQSGAGSVSLSETWNTSTGWQTTMRLAFSLLGEYTNTGFLEMTLGAAVRRPKSPPEQALMIEQRYYSMVKSMMEHALRNGQSAWSITSGGQWLRINSEIPHLPSYSLLSAKVS